MQRIARWFALSVVSFLASVAAVRAQSSYPMVMDVAPLAVQAGATTETEVSARYNLYAAYKILVSGSGVEAEIVLPDPPKELVKAETPAKDAKAAEKSDSKSDKKDAKQDDKKADSKKADDKGQKDEKKAEDKSAAMPAKKPEQPKLKVRFKVAADALPGVRDFRIATPQGVSTLGQLVVVRDPIIREKNPNNTLEQATEIKLPVTACGVIEAAEDVDFFKFHLDKPASLTFHVRSARCQDRIHDLQTHSDPLISIRNASGTVLALSDNYFFADPLLHYAFTQPGDYYLEIRDVRYQGNQYWQYSVEINDRPLVTNVFPMGLRRDEATRVELVGYNLPADPQVSVVVPKDLPLGHQWLNSPMASGAATPAPIYVHDLPGVLETAGNNSAERAQPISAPVCVSGRVAAVGEVDFYRFDAKKGESFRLEVIARRHQSQLDPTLAILNDKGQRLLENDDSPDGRLTTGDSCIESWVAPADGAYTLELRDLHLQGGAEFVYVIRVTRAAPHFTLWLDSDKTTLAPGTAGAVYVRATRRNGFTGEILLSVEGLPPGVKATCGRILDGQNDGCIVLEAAPDAKLAAANITIRGAGSMAEGDKQTELTAVADPYQEIYLPGGGRGLYSAGWHTVSVGDPLDLLNVKISPSKISLKPGESAKIDVTVERAPGFDKNVTLDVMYRHLGGVSGNSLPPGVTIDDKNSKTLIAGNSSTGHITLVAAKDAKPVEGQIVPMLAHVAINFVMKMSYSSEPLSITVEKP